MRRTAACERAGEVGVDGGALPEDDPPNDASLGLREKVTQWRGKSLAQPIERSGVTQIETG